jgi:hypothetical protein
MRKWRVKKYKNHTRNISTENRKLLYVNKFQVDMGMGEILVWTGFAKQTWPISHFYQVWLRIRQDIWRCLPFQVLGKTAKFRSAYWLSTQVSLPLLASCTQFYICISRSMPSFTYVLRAYVRFHSVYSLHTWAKFHSMDSKYLPFPHKVSPSILLTILTPESITSDDH